MNVKIHVNSQDKLTQVLNSVRYLTIDGAYEVTIKKLPKTRTAQQRKAIEVYCRELAKAWNEAGLTVQFVLSKTLDSEWSQELVKEAIYKKATSKALNKKSTTELSKEEVSAVYELVSRFASQFGVYVPFPEKY